MTGSERLIQSDLNIIVWSENEDELERKTDEILRALRSMNQAEGLVEMAEMLSLLRMKAQRIWSEQ
jgi:hypothetical protein